MCTQCSQSTLSPRRPISFLASQSTPQHPIAGRAPAPAPPARLPRPTSHPRALYVESAPGLLVPAPPVDSRPWHLPSPLITAAALVWAMDWVLDRSHQTDTGPAPGSSRLLLPPAYHSAGEAFPWPPKTPLPRESIAPSLHHRVQHRPESCAIGESMRLLATASARELSSLLLEMRACNNAVGRAARRRTRKRGQASAPTASDHFLSRLVFVFIGLDLTGCEAPQLRQSIASWLPDLAEILARIRLTPITPAAAALLHPLPSPPIAVTPSHLPPLLLGILEIR
jgi:hypothetical protein